MTVKSSKNLTLSQIGKVNPKAFELLSRKKLNPKLINQILITSADDVVLCRLGYYLQEKVRKGDKRALSILNKLVDAKVNPNELSRYRILEGLVFLANEGHKGALVGLVKGFEDSNYRHQIAATQALRHLARDKKNVSAQKILTERKIAW